MSTESEDRAALEQRQQQERDALAKRELAPRALHEVAQQVRAALPKAINAAESKSGYDPRLAEAVNFGAGADGWVLAVSKHVDAKPVDAEIGSEAFGAAIAAAGAQGAVLVRADEATKANLRVLAGLDEVHQHAEALVRRTNSARLARQEITERYGPHATVADYVDEAAEVVNFGRSPDGVALIQDADGTRRALLVEKPLDAAGQLEAIVSEADAMLSPFSEGERKTVRDLLLKHAAEATGDPGSEYVLRYAAAQVTYHEGPTGEPEPWFRLHSWSPQAPYVSQERDGAGARAVNLAQLLVLARERAVVRAVHGDGALSVYKPVFEAGGVEEEGTTFAVPLYGKRRSR